MSKIRVHLDLASDLPETLADPHQFQQVFLNLINNAVDAILEEGPEGDLWVCTGVQNGLVFVEFTDSGQVLRILLVSSIPFTPRNRWQGYWIRLEHLLRHSYRTRRHNSCPEHSARGATFRIELPAPQGSDFLPRANYLGLPPRSSRSEENSEANAARSPMRRIVSSRRYDNWPAISEKPAKTRPTG